MTTIVDKHRVREFSLVMAGHGVILCDKWEGAFIVLRYAEDVENLQKLLGTIEIRRLPADAPEHP